MRILHVIHSVDPRSGGPSHALREMVRAQLDAGHDIEILATTVQSAEPWAPTDEFVDRMQRDAAFQGADLTLLSAYGRRRPWSRWAYTPGASRALCNRLGRHSERPEVVHIHGTFSHLTTLAARRARRYGIPYVVRPAGSLNAKCLAQGSSRLKAMSIRMLLASELQHAGVVQAMSESEAAELAAFVPEASIRVIPHGICVQPSDLPETNVFLGRYPQLTGRPLILFLSRLHAKKRPELLIEALAVLPREFADATLVMAGSDAGALDEVRRVVERHALTDRVLFCGFLEGEMKSGAFRAADVFVLPSIDENFGVAVVEAMAHGTPVLVTPGVASHVYVDDSGCGLTVDGSVSSVVEGLTRLLGGHRNELGQRGRDYVIEHLSWPAIVRQLETSYRTGAIVT